MSPPTPQLSFSETALAQLEDIFCRKTKNGWAKSLEIRFDGGYEQSSSPERMIPFNTETP